MSKRPLKPKRSWEQCVDAFVAAVNVGVAVYERCGPPPDEDGLAHATVEDYARQSRELAKMATEAKPPFANAKSLAYLEDAFFGFWNESRGAHVAEFWAAIAERSLPYERKDILAGVIERGKIRDAIEHEHVMDGLGDTRLSTERRRALSEMLDAYEHGRARKKKR